MTTNYNSAGQDLDNMFVTNYWLVDRFVGGQLFVAGYNSATLGILGVSPAATLYSSPVQVGSLLNWKQIAVGSANAAAIKTDGTLWTWGGNTGGQLGAGTTAARSSPVQVGALTTWKQVDTIKASSGFANMCAVKVDGTLWVCGYNSVGQLGTGNTTSYSSPVQVGALTNWKQVSSSAVHSCAVKTDGTLWAWGSNTNGNLGTGNTTSYSSPVQVGTLTSWKQVSAAYGTGAELMAITNTAI